MPLLIRQGYKRIRPNLKQIKFHIKTSQLEAF